jgi:hypothetical protein
MPDLRDARTQRNGVLYTYSIAVSRKTGGLFRWKGLEGDDGRCILGRNGIGG